MRNRENGVVHSRFSARSSNPLINGTVAKVVHTVKMLTDGAPGRTRTGTPLTRQRILSPQRLPFRHRGLVGN